TPDFTDDISQYKIVDAVKSVSVLEKETATAENAAYRVVMWDFGANDNLVKALTKAGCDVTKVPYHTSAEEIIAMSPHGIVLSGGPGNPTELTDVITEIGQIKDIPMMGIGLGHQLLALSQGGKIEKLKYGHRGASVPVRNETTGKVYISSQNHSYQVVNDSVEAFGKISYRNVNDGTAEGIDYANIPAFSVQFNPESFSEPMNPAFLLGRFTQMMEVRKDAVK
ncbi:MAG: carbamoyl phosphate synthase small subunit, partial [Clostridia bacterium]|nr:carbamoyl phosphate synthase small subunit [Clostridia bacterium]